MSIKNFGGVDLSAATPANVGAAFTADSSFSFRVVNRGASDAKVKIGLSDTTAAFENANYLEYETVVAPGVPLTGDGLVAESGKFLVAESDSTSVNVIAYGAEG